MKMAITTASIAVRALVTGGLLLSGSAALAVENFGTGVRAETLNCFVISCFGGASSGGNTTVATPADGVQELETTNSVSGVQGTASVTATLVDSGMGFTTMLQTGTANSNVGGVAPVEGHTLEHYTYSGPTTRLDIIATMEGTVIGPKSGEDSFADVMEGNLFLVTDPAATEKLDLYGSTFARDCLFTCFAPDTFLVLTINGVMENVTDTITILTLNDGDEFYLYGQFKMGAAGGGFASTTTGFGYTFSDTAGLSSRGAQSSAADTDGDGVADDLDNCPAVVNADQRATNNDRLGNLCDAVFNNDLVSNFADLGLLLPFLFSE